jgi:hypothetical protein
VVRQVAVSCGLELSLLRHMANELSNQGLISRYIIPATFTHKSESNSPRPKIVHEKMKKGPGRQSDETDV